MVSEIILAVKERNKQTRATAFELLVQVRCTQLRVVGWAGSPSRQCPELHTSLYAPGPCITHPILSLQIAHAMHEAEPPPPGLGLGGDAAMAEDGEAAAAFEVLPNMPEAHSLAACTGRPAPADAAAAAPCNAPCSEQTRFTPFFFSCPGTPAERGGLHTLFTMVLGGLVGATPHMISAAVMALVGWGSEPLASVGRARGAWLWAHGC